MCQHPRSVDDYISAIRRDAVLPIYKPSAVSTVESTPSFVETETLKKPLTVSQFSEWLHNLYYDEEKKRQSAIKYMLENDFPKPTSTHVVEPRYR